jgi:hypothetical protein
VSDLLQIDKQSQLQNELHQYQQKNQEESLMIKGRLQERDEQINALIKKQEQFENMIHALIDSGQLKPVT